MSLRRTLGRLHSTGVIARGEIEFEAVYEVGGCHRVHSRRVYLFHLIRYRDIIYYIIICWDFTRCAAPFWIRSHRSAAAVL